jgi:hypothetical protein
LAKGKGVFSARLSAGVVILGVIAIIIITVYYYYNYYPIRPFYPPPPTAGKLDKFGIKEIYLSKRGGEEWYLSTDNPQNGPRTGAEGPPTSFVQKNNDGSWKVQSSEVRYGVFTSSGYHPDLITTLNQQVLAAKGYMQSSNDWKNVEITGYFKVNSFTDSKQNGGPHIELVARGGRNTNDIGTIDGLSRQCEATTYHSNSYVDGRVKFEKDLEHTIGYTTGDPEKQHATSPLLGRWIGIKAVFYNLPDGSVRLEQWIDENSNNNWHRVLRFTDNGNWGGGQPNCGGTDHTIITWGGPIAIFRWDNINDMDVIDLSIREIQQPS